MDLTRNLARNLARMANLSRAHLEAEARKRQLRDPERHSRTELVMYILKHDYGAGRRLRGARKMLLAVADTAMSLGEAAFRGRTHIPDLPPLPYRPPSERPPQASLRGERAPLAAQAPAAAPETRLEPGSSAAAAAAILRDLSTPATSTYGSPASGAATRSFIEEPVRTHSMAQLLAVQGHKERALSIYEELIAKGAGGEALVREAERVRRDEPLEPQASALPRPDASLRTALPASSERVVCEEQSPGEVCLRWSTSAEGRTRARALLGGTGELTLRLVIIRPDPERIVCSEIVEHGPVDDSGQWASLLPGLHEDGTRDATHDATHDGARQVRCFGAIGMRAGERFVSIAHAPLTSLQLT